MKKLLLTLFIISCALPGISRTSKGKEFWIAFMENISLSLNGPPAFKVHVSSDVTTTCTLSVPYTGFTSTFVVQANSVYVVNLPTGNFHPLGDEATANNGLRITANDSVEVKAFHHRVYFTESTMVLPLHELGSEYLVMAQSDGMNTSPSEFVVLATQANTTLEITPSAVTLGTRPIGVTYTVLLQQGQMYQLQAAGDLTGSSVRSADPLRKIAVFGGARQAQVGLSCTSGSDDHVYDQSYPVSSFGTNYHLIPFSGHISDVIKVMASQNSTTVTVTGLPPFTLNKGQFTIIPLTTSGEITASQPVAVTQVATSQGCNGPANTAIGDPGMINLVPSHLYQKKAVFYTVPSLKMGIQPGYFPNHRLNIVIKNSAIGNLKLDNVAVPSSSFTPVAGNTAYSYARLVLDTLGALQHTLSCDSGFNATIYSLASFNFYGHHLGYCNPSKEISSVGIHENEAGSSLSVFPVPAGERLNVRADKPVRSVLVMDLFGKEVLMTRFAGSSEVNLDLAALPDGIYYCIVQYEGTKTAPEVIKFVKLQKE